MVYSDSDLIKMCREDMIQLPTRSRLHWFKLLQVKHRELESVIHDMAHLIDPDIETRIISLIGMTGIGKTTMARQIINTMLKNYWGDSIKPNDIPYIFVPAPANGEKSFSWGNFYTRALRSANEILIDKKVQDANSEGVSKILKSHRSTVVAMREALESLIIHRNVRVLAIDEATHMLRFDHYAAVMDTIKSLGDIHNVKILLIGSYDLFDLVTDYGQTARRGEILHYKRYHENNDEYDDKAEFKAIIEKLQHKWPCNDIPNFAAISDELMQATLGSVGILKALMLSSLKLQLSSKNESWRPEHLKKASKSVKMLNKIRIETEHGEEKIAGACYGESFFSGNDFFSRISQKMGAAR